MDPKQIIKTAYLRFRAVFLAICVHRRARDPIIPTRILVIRIDRIGDLVVSLPCIRALKTLFPNAHCAILVQPQAMPLLEGVAWIDEKIPYEGFWKTIGVLRARKFTLAVDLLMDYTIKTAFLAHASGAAVTAGFDIAGRGRCFTIPVKPSEEKKMMYRHVLDLAAAVAAFFSIDAARIPQDRPCLTVSPESRQRGAEFLEKHGIAAGERVCGIHPGAKFPSQCWQPEKFAQLADRIKEAYNAAIVIIGNSHERSLSDRIAGLMKHKPVIAAGLPLCDAAGVIARMDLLICNNSGPLHIAAALGVPTVSTMGPTVAHLWHPAGEAQIVVRKELPCSPCDRAVCDAHRCMDEISVDEMFAPVAGLLERKGARS